MRTKQRLYSILSSVNPNVAGPHIAEICHEAAYAINHEQLEIDVVLHYLKNPDECSGGSEGSIKFAIDTLERLVKS